VNIQHLPKLTNKYAYVYTFINGSFIISNNTIIAAIYIFLKKHAP